MFPVQNNDGHREPNQHFLSCSIGSPNKPTLSIRLFFMVSDTAEQHKGFGGEKNINFPMIYKN